MIQSSTSPLQVRGAVKRFRQGSASVEALAGVDFTVRPGEFVAIMGASGSGKSTLLHAIAGLTMLDEGEVRVDGRNLAEMSDAALTRFRRQHIGLVFQSFNLIPTLSAEDNIQLPAIDKRGLDERVDALLLRLGVARRRHHRPDALSGGEQQRVAIARALVANPSLVLADEPTGSLDSVSGQAICRLLAELCTEQRRTIVLVTHEPTVACWANRVVVLKDGRVLSEFDAHQGDSHTLAAMYQDAIDAHATERCASSAIGVAESIKVAP